MAGSFRRHLPVSEISLFILHISKKMAAELAEMGINFITKTRRNIKPVKRSSFEIFFLAKRAIVEAVIGQSKEICQIEHSRHRKPDNFLVNLLAALAAYTLKPRKPSINLKAIGNTDLIPSWRQIGKSQMSLTIRRVE